MALFAWLTKWVPPKAAFVTALAIFLGAAPLPYTTMMFSHSFVVGLLALSLFALDLGPQRNIRASLQNDHSAHGQEALDQDFPSNAGRQEVYSKFATRDALGGLFCGFALASEFTAGIIVASIGVCLATVNWQRAIVFSLGALPALLLIPAYNLACFGNPFLLPYSLQASFPEMREGLYAIKWPDLEIAFNLLFTPARGLFFGLHFLR